MSKKWGVFAWQLKFREKSTSWLNGHWIFTWYINILVGILSSLINLLIKSLKEPFKWILKLFKESIILGILLSLYYSFFFQEINQFIFVGIFLLTSIIAVEKTYQIHDSQGQYRNNHPAGSSVVPVYYPDLYVHGSLTPSIQHVHQNMSTSFIINFS